MVEFYTFLVFLTWIGAGLGACPNFAKCNCYMNEAEIECYEGKIDKMALQKISKTLDPSKVIYLDFFNNEMEEFHPEYFSNYTKLEYIYIDRNKLTGMPKRISDFIPNLKDLWLTENPITSLNQQDLEGYHNMEALTIESSAITSLQPGVFKNLKSLKILQIGGIDDTVLRNGTFLGLNQLESLTLKRSQLKTIESGAFLSLKNKPSIHLPANELTTFQPGTFVNTKDLILYNNKLQAENIPDGTFINVTGVYLGKNNITTVRRDWFNIPPAFIRHTLHLSKPDPLHCDCNLYGNLKAFNNKTSFLNFICKTPAEMAGVDFNDVLRDNSLNCTVCDHQPCNKQKPKTICKPLDEDTFSCHCPEGLSGKNCEIVDTICDDQPCKHNSTCKLLDKETYICDCRQGYYGKNCEFLKSKEEVGKEEDSLSPVYIVLIVVILVALIIALAIYIPVTR